MIHTQIVMVTGSRDFTNEALVRWALRRVWIEHERVLLIHGDARGADRICARVARHYGFLVRAFPPDPRQPTPQRYHARNDLMFLEQPDQLIAFRHAAALNRGTDSVIRKAVQLGIPYAIYTQTR